MILPWLIGAAALGAAYLLYRLFKRKKDPDKDSEDDKSNQPEEQEFQDPKNEKEYGEQKTDLINQLREDLKSGRIKSSPSGVYDKLPKKYDPILNMWNNLQKIVNQINFFERKISINKKVGENLVVSATPTGESQIVPMQSIADLPKSLSGNLGMDDEMFYPLVATNGILIQQPIAYEGVYEENFILLRKTLRVLQDVSGSQEGDRMAWSRVLDTLLITKARNSQADLVLTTFTETPVNSIATSEETGVSYQEVNTFIDRYVHDGGGTKIGVAVNSELDLIEKENKEMGIQQNAQIVLITDGTEGIDQNSIIKKLKDNKVLLHTVVLGVEHQQLRQLSDKFHYLNIPAKNE